MRVALAAAAMVPSVLLAQGDCTTAAPVNQDACQKAKDMFAFMLPQLGVSLSGGNAVLGSTGTIGKLGHFNFGLHATALNGDLPQFDNTTVSITGPSADNIETKKQILGMPNVDAQIGLFGGIPLGLTHVGTVDGLVSVTYIPNIPKDNSGSSALSFDGHMKFGFGARVGLIDEAIIIPAVSFTYLQRGLPSLSLTSTSQDGASLGVQNLSIDVNTWRLMATKSFLLFAISAGFGGDSYKSDGIIVAQAPTFTPDSVSLGQTMKRTNWFVDLTLKLGPVKVAGEVGGVTGGTMNTFNNFDPKANAARQFASLGVRIGL
jgi:hypothetical protein